MAVYYDAVLMGIVKLDILKTCNLACGNLDHGRICQKLFVASAGLIARGCA
jgi:hypothetical protein